MNPQFNKPPYNQGYNNNNINMNKNIIKNTNNMRNNMNNNMGNNMNNNMIKNMNNTVNGLNNNINTMNALNNKMNNINLKGNINNNNINSNLNNLQNNVNKRPVNQMTQQQTQHNFKNPYLDTSLINNNYAINPVHYQYQNVYAQYRVNPNMTGYHPANNYAAYAQNSSAYKTEYAQDKPIDPAKINPYAAPRQPYGDYYGGSYYNYGTNYNNPSPYNTDKNRGRNGYNLYAYNTKNNNITNKNNNNSNNNNNNNSINNNDATVPCKDGMKCHFNKIGKCIWGHDNKKLVKCYNGPNCATKIKPNRYGKICKYNHDGFNDANKEQSISLGIGNDLDTNSPTPKSNYNINNKYKRDTMCKLGDDKCTYNTQGRCIWGHYNKAKIFCKDGPSCTNKDKANKYGQICQYNHGEFNNVVVNNSNNNNNTIANTNIKTHETKDDEKDSNKIITPDKPDDEPPIQNNRKCTNEECEYHKDAKCIFMHPDKNSIKCAKGTSCESKNATEYNNRCLYNHD